MTGPKALEKLLDGTATSISRPTGVTILKDLDLAGIAKFMVFDPFDDNLDYLPKDHKEAKALVDTVKFLLISDILLHDDWEIDPS